MAQVVAEQTGNSVRDQLMTELQTKADATNKERGKAKGTRVRVGQTRGKNPKVISWEAFDTDQPETLPSKITEFMALTKINEERFIVPLLIDGFNAAQYAAASDVLSEYLEPNWDDTTAANFRKAVQGYAAATQVSLEDAVSIIKPGVQKAFEARMAQHAAEQSAPAATA